jgi:hypothetical protein
MHLGAGCRAAIGQPGWAVTRSSRPAPNLSHSHLLRPRGRVVAAVVFTDER